jgi:hypothetical protein
MVHNKVCSEIKCGKKNLCLNLTTCKNMQASENARLHAMNVL